MTVSISCKVIFHSKRRYSAKTTVTSCLFLRYRLQSFKVRAEILD
ncbi:hypothetical protein V1290_002171 [Bradyrhizobium sp. AZCC 1578]